MEVVPVQPANSSTRRYNPYRREGYILSKNTRTGVPQNETADPTDNGAPKDQDPKVQTDIQKLQSTDRNVRNHEAAHLAAAGGLATGGANFTFQRGPDGRLYAIGGEVNINTSPGKTPQETLTKARQIRAAALAPADPSPQDMAVANQASQMEAEAMQEIASNPDGDEKPSQTAFKLKPYQQQNSPQPSLLWATA